MTLYKNYLKLVKANKGSILLYAVIFLVIASLNVLSMQSPVTQYTEVQPKIHLTNLSTDPISEGLVRYLDQKTEIIETKNNLDDELFYRSIDAIVKIPLVITDQFEVKTTGEAKGDYVKTLITRYLNVVNSYDEVNSDVIEESLNILSQESTVSYFDSENEANSMKENAKYFFNGLNYPIMAIIILVISLIAGAYQEKTIKMRQEVSSMPQSSYQFQMVLGHITLGIGIWLLFMISALMFELFGYEILNSPHYLINSFIFTVSVVAMANFLVSVITNRRVIGSLATVLSLGSSFLSGSFVPQELLSEQVLTVSKVFPSYWFIKNNEYISTNSIDKLYYNNIFIMIGFIILFTLISFLVRKFKMSQSQARQ